MKIFEKTPTPLKNSCTVIRNGRVWEKWSLRHYFSYEFCFIKKYFNKNLFLTKGLFHGFQESFQMILCKSLISSKILLYVVFVFLPIVYCPFKYYWTTDCGQNLLTCFENAFVSDHLSTDKPVFKITQLGVIHEQRGQFFGHFRPPPLCTPFYKIRLAM